MSVKQKFVDEFDEDYYLRGRETGKSLYENYRWLPELTIPMVWAMVEYLGIKRSHTVLDYGCARGYTVRAFREIGYHARGVDISEWAISNCDPAVVNFVSTKTEFADDIDWIIAKDVLEHVQPVANTVYNMMETARVGVFAVVPLGYGDGYIIPEYDRDVTHVHRWSLPSWVKLFIRPGWAVTACYRVPGIKDNYAKHPTGNGFITARRIK